MATKNHRILFSARSCYLDNSSGAVVASRSMVEAMARRGFAVEFVYGVALDAGGGCPSRPLAFRARLRR